MTEFERLRRELAIALHEFHHRLGSRRTSRHRSSRNHHQGGSVTTSERRMKVIIHLLSQSQPIARTAVNTYTKDGLFCVYLDGGCVEKYPLVNVFRVVEDYTTEEADR